MGSSPAERAWPWLGARDALLVGVAVGLGVLVIEVISGASRGIHYLKALRLGDLGLPLLVLYPAVFGAAALGCWLVISRLVRGVALRLHVVLLGPLLLVVGGLLAIDPGLWNALGRWPWVALVPGALALGLGAPALALHLAPRLRAAIPFLLAAATFVLAGICTRIRLLVPIRDAGQLAQLGVIALGGGLLALYLALVLRRWGYRPLGRALTRANAFLLGVALALVVMIPGRWLHPLPPGPYAGPERPKLLLIAIDTLRADAVSPLGADPGATPALSELAADGIVFERAYAAAPWTLPSFASLLTSTYTHEHQTGLRDPAIFLRRALAPSVPTLAETLQGAGYLTGASVTNSYLEPRYGLDRGFDTYEPLSWRFQFHPPLVFLYERLIGGRPWYVPAERQERRIADLIERLEETGAPWFVLAHLFDPHEPYHDHGAGLDPGDDVARYRAEVTYADAWIGALMRRLRERGLYDGMLIAFTADHGEELTEVRETLRARGMTPHGFSLYDELIRVPLVLKLPGNQAAGRRVRAPVSLVDLGPTLLAAAGVEAPDSFRGRDLRLALSDGAAFERRPIFAGGLMELEQMSAVVLGSRKLVAARDEPGRAASAAFDLAEDPGETRPVPLAEGPGYAGLFEVLEQELGGAGPAAPGGLVELNPAQRERLEALGYVE